MANPNIKYPKVRKKKRRYICPHCGQKCISPWHAGSSGFRDVLRFYAFMFQFLMWVAWRRVGTIKCAECGVRLSVRVKYKQHCVKRWSRALKFFSGILAAIAFVVFWESTGSDAFFIPFLLTILVLFFLPGILFSMPVALGRRKKIFAVMDMDEQRSSEAGAIFISAAMVAVPPLKEVAFDIQAQLDFTGMACPEHVVYDYSTYDLRFSSDGESYPVLLGIAVLNGEVKYFELEFLGKTYGIIRPDIKEGQAFELEDYKGNHIHGVITKIYKST